MNLEFVFHIEFQNELCSVFFSLLDLAIQLIYQNAHQLQTECIGIFKIYSLRNLYMLTDVCLLETMAVAIKHKDLWEN